MAYQCPLCHLPLRQNHQQWRCEHNHQFDLAKEGYVNLLPVQYKRSKQPGDSAEMMRARREFLDAGHYQPLQQHVAELLNAVVARDAQNLLDIGCGEGYYTAAVATQLQQCRTITVYGLDVAKIAIRYAARRYRQVNFCVASSQRLPFADASLDAILRIYAPCQEQELARTVKPGGYVVTVTPGPRHLYQLKAAIYQDVQLHAEHPEVWAGFHQVQQQTLAYTMTLKASETLNLLQMTPFAWRASAEARQQLAAHAVFQCETDFVIRLHQRQAE